MKLTAQQQSALDLFPKALYRLIHAELSAGNSIVEVGHSFPAPPAGAYIKLANVVSTQPRASHGDLAYRARNSSLSSGEFTDGDRFYFIVEPPSATAGEEPEPVRPTLEATPTAPVPATPTSTSAPVRREPPVRSVVPAGVPRPRPNVHQPAPEPIATSAPSGARYSLNFHDSRAPYEMQIAMERDVPALFVPVLEGERLCLRATAHVNGGQYLLELRFEAALASTNAYTFSADCSWPSGTEHEDYFRRTSLSWFKLWTGGLAVSKAPTVGEGSAERYRVLRDEALHAEAHLDSVTALQQAVIRGLKNGGRYGSSNKEGDTRITWSDGAFVRTDTGDYPAFTKYADEAEFLLKLRQFLHWDVTRNAAKDSLSEIDVWRLILRQMYAS